MIGADALLLSREVAGLPLRAGEELHLSLRGVEAIDGSGVAALVRVHSNLSVSGRRLVLTDVRTEVAERLRGLGLADLLPIVVRRGESAAPLGFEPEPRGA